MAKIVPYKSVNREISWLSFNERVLQEAEDSSNPLLERVRFLGIFSNNLDEFFRVRVASIRRLAGLGKRARATLSFDPLQLLSDIDKIVLRHQRRYRKSYVQIEKELKTEGIYFLRENKLSPAQEDFAQEYFNETVRHLLSPIMLDSRRPFPELNDGALYLGVKLSFTIEDTSRYAILELPSSTNRFVVFPKEGDARFVMWLDDLIRLKLKRLFAIFGVDKAEAYSFKITRDAELDIDDDISKSQMEKMRKSLAKRKSGDYVRFLYDEEMPRDMVHFFLKKMNITDTENVTSGARYHNKKDLMGFPDFGKKQLSFKKLLPLPHPVLQGKTSIFNEIRKRDLFLHYPYQSFDYVIDLLREAAIDPLVRSIRINLYRVAKNSKVTSALMNAAQNGKKVVVMIELSARFDEQNNLFWSNKLQEAGVRVVFGFSGMKVHSKLILIRRKEGTRSVRYAHIGTGNFHEKTARIYGDLSLLTADNRITGEVRRVFSLLEDPLQRPVFRNLLVSPFGTRRKFTQLIVNETKNATKGNAAWIKLKINNLVDEQLIKKLYEASQAGVKIELIIRGVCALIPGVKGLSENITVVSIVGRFLEHARFVIFCNNEQPLYFISSADWMLRNLDHRVEVTAPIFDPKRQKELSDIFELQHADNQKSRIIDKEQRNKYREPKTGETLVNAQLALYEYYKNKVKKKD